MIQLKHLLRASSNSAPTMWQGFHEFHVLISLTKTTGTIIMSFYTGRNQDTEIGSCKHNITTL